MGTAPSDIFSALWIELQTYKHFQQNEMHTYHQFVSLWSNFISLTRCQDNRTKYRACVNSGNDWPVMNAVLNFLSQWKSDIRYRANLQNGGKHPVKHG